MPPLEEPPQAIADADEARERLNEIAGLTGDEPPTGVQQAGTIGAAAAIAAATGKPQCPACFRVMEVSWTSCVFCDSGMLPLPAEMPVQEGQEVYAPVAFGPDGAPPAEYYSAQHQQQAQAPQQQVIAGPQYYRQSDEAQQVQQAQQAQQPAAEENPTVALAPGLTNCPRCGRPVPADWQECLYCKAGV